MHEKTSHLARRSKICMGTEKDCVRKKNADEWNSDFRLNEIESQLKVKFIALDWVCIRCWAGSIAKNIRSKKIGAMQWTQQLRYSLSNVSEA